MKREHVFPFGVQRVRISEQPCQKSENHCKVFLQNINWSYSHACCHQKMQHLHRCQVVSITSVVVESTYMGKYRLVSADIRPNKHEMVQTSYAKYLHQGQIQNFGQGGPAEFWPQGGPEPTICSKQGFFSKNCLKTARFWKKSGGQVHTCWCLGKFFFPWIRVADAGGPHWIKISHLWSSFPSLGISPVEIGSWIPTWSGSPGQSPGSAALFLNYFCA